MAQHRDDFNYDESGYQKPRRKKSYQNKLRKRNLSYDDFEDEIHSQAKQRSYSDDDEFFDIDDDDYDNDFPDFEEEYDDGDNPDNDDDLN